MRNIFNMKMKKTILFPLLVLSAIQLTTAQKIILTYKVKSTDSLYIIKDKAFPDITIQTKSDKIFSEKISNKDIVSIEDNTNRRFDKINFNNTNYYSKLINEGYFKFYDLKINDKPTYLIYSKNDTVLLEKNDTLVNQTMIKDRKYNGKLVLLSKEYPELWELAGKVDFRKNDLQNFISVLNQKHGGNNIIRKENNRIDYLSLSLKGMVQRNKTDIMLDVIMSHYFIDISPNLSFKYGLMANYIQQTEFFPELSSGWYYTKSGQDEVRQEIFIYRNHYETMTGKAIEIPLLLNYEITNSKITPYIFGGLSPTLYFRKITRTDSDAIDNISKFTLNAIAAGGVKLKLTNSLNILTEYRFEILKGSNIEFGIEYFFKL